MAQLQPVNVRLQQLLDRVAQLKRASDIDRPVEFNAAGAKHAAAIASADEKRHAKSAGYK